MTRETVIEKIKKLRALSQSDNVGEAAAAAAGMARLMSAHQIEEAEIDVEAPEVDEPIENWDFLDPDQKGATTWQSVLLNGLAESMFCMALCSSPRHGHRGSLRVYGTATNLTAVRYLYQAVTGDIERLLGTWAMEQEYGVSRADRTAFRYGAACAISARIRLELRAQRQAASLQHATALVRVDREANRANEFVQSNMRVRIVTKNLRTNSVEAYHAGREAGGRIQVGGSAAALGAPPLALNASR